MKIVVTSKGENLSSEMDQRFGRAPYFIIVDTDTSETKAIDNKAVSASGGAGITAGQTMIDNSIEAIITGNVGPNAMNVLTTGKIAIYKGLKDTVEKNVEAFKEGKLDKIDTAVSAHYGMGNQGG